MPPTPQQFRERWKTPDGRRRLGAVIRALRHRPEKNWEENLVGFTGVNEVENGHDLRYAPLARIRTKGAHLGHADLTGAGFSSASLTGADLGGANLTGADLRGTELCKASFEGTKFGGTNLTAIRFAPDHPVSFDGSDTIRYTARAPWLTWALLRKIGQFPLFGVSWFSFVLSVAAINIIGALNQRMQQVAARLKDLGGTDAFYHWLQTPIPIPYRMELIILASILLVIGTTIYKLACPSAVQEFSESQWVAEHHQPRLLYYREMWRRRWLQWPTLICSVLGAALALFLIGERFVMAIGYMLR